MELVFLLSQSLLFHFRIVFRWLTSWFGAACMGGSIGARLCVYSCMRCVFVSAYARTYVCACSFE